MVTTDIVLPELDSGVSGGELVTWLVDPGDHVAADQTIAEVETDKSLVAVPAPATGVVAELRADPGATIAEGDVLAVMEVDEGTPEETESDAPEETESDAPEETEHNAPEETEHDATAAPDAASDPEETATAHGGESAVASGRVFAPPRVRRLARDLSVDISTVEGTGDGGAITESDVRAAAEKRSASEDDSTTSPREFTGGKTVTGRREEAASPRSLSASKPAVRRREGDAEPLADRVEADPETSTGATGGSASTSESPSTGESVPTSESPSTDGAASTTGSPSTTEHAPSTEPASAPPSGSVGAGTQTTHHDAVDVTAMQSARERLTAAGVADGAVTDLTFAIAAVAAALEAVPALNGPIEDGEIDRRDAVNVAVAVPTDDGLVDPVVVDATDVSLPVLAREVAELVERAREGSLSAPETADATFTVTDFGALGGTYATPSVAATGTAALALGEIRQRPRIHDGEVAPRAVLPLSAAVDARAVDGTAAAQFLTEVRRYLNTPELLLIE